MMRMATWKARLPRVRYASRARPGPPEKPMNSTPSPTRTQGMRKMRTFIRRGILMEPADARAQTESAREDDLSTRLVRARRALARARGEERHGSRSLACCG